MKGEKVHFEPEMGRHVKDMYRLTRWALIDASSQSVGIRKSDRLLLASDSLMTLGDEETARILKNNPNALLEKVAAALIQAVEEARHPHQDNTTVLLYRPKADCGRACFPRSLEK
ncbi:MAG: hypothetical protein OXG87_01515 [Gemmatimonadetes bacterium]|nr:hypothetical protein [Gemmatimonadota bacterium]